LFAGGECIKQAVNEEGGQEMCAKIISCGNGMAIAIDKLMQFPLTYHLAFSVLLLFILAW